MTAKNSLVDTEPTVTEREMQESSKKCCNWRVARTCCCQRKKFVSSSFKVRCGKRVERKGGRGRRNKSGEGSNGGH